MQDRTEKKNKQSKKCIANEALISLLTTYHKEEILDAFNEANIIFKDWLETEAADDSSRRQDALYAYAILEQLQVVVKGINVKKMKKLYTQIQQDIKAA